MAINIDYTTDIINSIVKRSGIVVDVLRSEYYNAYELRLYDPKHELVIRSLIRNECLVNPDTFTQTLSVTYGRISRVSGRLTFYKNKARMKGLEFRPRVWNRLIKETR